MEQSIIAVMGTDSSVVGCVSWWRLSGDATLAHVVSELTARGLGEEFHPEKPSASAVLKRTMDSLFGSRNTLVKPLDGENGYALLTKSKDGNGKPMFTTKWTAKVDKDGFVSTDGDIGDGEREDLLDWFSTGQETLSQQDIGSTWLAGTIMPALNAVRLRDTGGIYFVPASSVETLHKIREALKACSKHVVEEIPAMRTEEAIEAVLRSIEAECEQTATVLGEKIQEWSSAQAKLERKVRKSTMERQAVVAEATEKKLASYEAMLGMRLDGLHTKFEKLQANLSAAILAADADQDI